MTKPHFKLKIDEINIKQNTFESKVLEFLKEAGYLILDASFPKKYYAYTGLWRELFGLDLTAYQRYKKELERTILSALQRLEDKDLVIKIKSKEKKRYWLLTNQGKKVITQLDNLKLELPPEDNQLRIFVFDIPEKQRKIRDELRINLISFGYKMLQKSVWIGKRPLPLEFFKEIKEMGLWQNVHFFEIKEGGTLDDLEI
ncbi:MAG: CRISPR-associated endonuclease Cas2 [Minisyncoccia bacterium]